MDRADLDHFSQNLFIIIGAQRCGSTYLYKLLDDHPEVQMNHPVSPEPKFFIEEDQYASGSGFYYATYFSGGSSVGDQGARRYGEKSTSYLEYGWVADRIATMFPHAKVIVILRNPAERALSNYYFTKQHGLEDRTARAAILAPDPTVEAAVATSVSPYAYFKRGLYQTYLAPYMQRFGSNMHIVLFENLITSNEEFRQVSNFLGVSPTSKSVDAIVNQSVRPVRRSRAEQSLVTELTELYASSVEELELLTGKDLSVWK